MLIILDDVIVQWLWQRFNLKEVGPTVGPASRTRDSILFQSVYDTCRESELWVQV